MNKKSKRNRRRSRKPSLQVPATIVEPFGDPSEPAIRVVENWYEEFRDREQD